MFKKRVGFFLLVLFFACEKTDVFEHNQPLPTTGTIDLVQTFGGSLNDVAQAVVATNDGGFAVLGRTQSNDGDVTGKTSQDFDLWLLKFDDNANLLWNKTYGGSDDDRGADLLYTSDGGFLILGSSKSTDGNLTNNNGLRDIWLAKLDGAGNLEWQKNFGYSGNDEGFALTQTSDNHYLVTGVLDVTASGGDGNINKQRHAGGDYWVLKLALNGDLVWARYFGGSFTDTPYGITENDGNIYIVGSSDSDDVDINNNIGSYDYWVVKANSAGNLMWEKSYGGTEIDEGRAIVKHNNNEFLTVGDTRSSDMNVSVNKGGADVWVIKTDVDGDILWEKSYGGSNFDVARTIHPTFDGNYIVAGSSRSLNGDLTRNNGQNDAWIFKIDDTGSLLWETSVGGSNIDIVYDVVQLANGSIIAVGESSSADLDIPENKGFADLMIIKLN